jgi:dynein heavy chain 1
MLCVFYYILQTFHVWLGGLLNPEAYITATRQCIAQANSWSLEELVLDVTITDGGLDSNKPSLDECSFGVVGKFSDC